MFGLPDEAFIRGNAPMTKKDVRALSLLRLNLKTDSIVMDIGAGTGSISIEAANYARQGQVYAVERHAESIALIKQNKAHFGLDHLHIIEGYAPEVLPMDMSFDAIFVGGSGGQIEPILSWSLEHLKKGGRLVVNTITIENTGQATAYLKNAAVGDLEVIQVAISKGRFVGQVTMMEAQNPIMIISCTKKEEGEN